jgi:hypothetical protein
MALGCKTSSHSTLASGSNDHTGGYCSSRKISNTSAHVCQELNYSAPADVQQAFKDLFKSPDFVKLAKKDYAEYKKDLGDFAVANGRPTEVEAVAIRVYSSRVFKAVNSALRSDDPIAIDEYLPLVNTLISGLRGMPRYSGKVFRGANFEDKNALEQEIQKLEDSRKSGDPYQEHAFTSTTRGDPEASGFAGNMNYVIDSKTGVDISAFSRAPFEEEVLIAPGAFFRVTNIEKSGIGENTVYSATLEEIE